MWHFRRQISAHEHKAVLSVLDSQNKEEGKKKSTRLLFNSFLSPPPLPSLFGSRVHNKFSFFLLFLIVGSACKKTDSHHLPLPLGDIYTPFFYHFFLCCLPPCHDDAGCEKKSGHFKSIVLLVVVGNLYLSFDYKQMNCLTSIDGNSMS